MHSSTDTLIDWFPHRHLNYGPVSNAKFLPFHGNCFSASFTPEFATPSPGKRMSASLYLLIASFLSLLFIACFASAMRTSYFVLFSSAALFLASSSWRC